MYTKNIKKNLKRIYLKFQKIRIFHHTIYIKTTHHFKILRRIKINIIVIRKYSSFHLPS